MTELHTNHTKAEKCFIGKIKHSSNQRSLCHIKYFMIQDAVDDARIRNEM